MELKDLEGNHILSGVQFSEKKFDDDYEIANVLDFILDGAIFSAIEDPDDGYRSCMKEIVIGRKDAKVNNTFDGVKVIGKYIDNGHDDKIDFIDILTNKIVLSVGTEDYDDYYPCFLAEWHPENLCLNNK